MKTESSISKIISKELKEEQSLTNGEELDVEKLFELEERARIITESEGCKLKEQALRDIAKELGLPEEDYDFAKKILIIKGINVVDNEELSEDITQAIKEEPDNSDLQALEEELKVFDFNAYDELDIDEWNGSDEEQEKEKYYSEELTEDTGDYWNEDEFYPEEDPREDDFGTEDESYPEEDSDEEEYGADDDTKYSKDDILNNPFQMYYADIRKYPLLTDEEIRELAEKIRKGDNFAKTKLINSNLRLVVKAALQYASIQKFDLLLDLIQEGNAGLIKAAEKYDYTLGYKFSTYAWWWIEQGVKRELSNQNYPFKVPEYIQQSIEKMKFIVKRLTLEIGRDPTDTEIAKEMGIPLKRVKELKKYSIDPTSLNMEIGKNKDREVHEVIQDNSVSQSEIAESSDLRKRLCRWMSEELTINEVKVLILRFGLPFSVTEDAKAEHAIIQTKIDKNGFPLYIEPMTIAKTGKQLGMSEYQVKSNEKKALLKLKIALSEKGIKDYLY